MKLFTRYNRLNLLTIVAVFMAAGIVFYFFFRSLLISQVDDDLEIEKKEIEAYAASHTLFPEALPVRHLIIMYKPVEEPFRQIKYETIEAFDSTDKDKDDFRKLTFGVRLKEKEFQVLIMKPLETVENLLWYILLITLATVMIALTAFYFINRKVLKKLWAPFFDSLSKTKCFSLEKNVSVDFADTDIDEFTEMNTTLKTTISNAQKDYRALKEFIGNASHEIQTPLAVIHSKLDIMIQDEKLSENQSILAQGVYEALERLSHLNNSLLLLTKIGNRQFTDTSNINLKEKINEKIVAFNELWTVENIEITSALEDISLKINPELLELLLNNLLINATRHNVSNGIIHITLKPGSLTIKNTGNTQSLDTNRLFSKFYTEKRGSGHNGLGLSIIKDICEASGLDVHYAFNDSLHSFTLNW